MDARSFTLHLIMAPNPFNKTMRLKWSFCEKELLPFSPVVDWIMLIVGVKRIPLGFVFKNKAVIARFRIEHASRRRMSGSPQANEVMPIQWFEKVGLTNLTSRYLWLTR